MLGERLTEVKHLESVYGHSQKMYQKWRPWYSFVLPEYCSLFYLEERYLFCFEDVFLMPARVCLFPLSVSWLARHTLRHREVGTARLAQSAERKALNLVVVGSSPTVDVFYSPLFQNVYRKCGRGVRKNTTRGARA